MSTSAPPLGGLRASRPFPERTGPTGSLVYRLITTTDHKLIGIMYVVACFTFFFVGGLMALLIRGELAAPGLQFLSNEQYNCSPCTARSCWCFMRPQLCSDLPTWCCPCRSAPPMSPSLGSTQYHSSSLCLVY